MTNTFTRLFSLLLLWVGLSHVTIAQVEFKVILTDQNSYQVSLRSNINWDSPLNTTNNGQVTVRVPTGGFVASDPVSQIGTWGRINHIIAPAENPGMDYIVFALQSPTTDIPYQNNMEVDLFTFQNTGSCTGELMIIDNDTDPFIDNSLNIGVGNRLTVLGAGPGANAYTGNYDVGGANCAGIGDCGITVTGVLKTSPSTCGVADGVMEIIAFKDEGMPPMQFTINDGDSWQDSNVFEGLAANTVYVVKVRDIAAICTVEWGEEELDAPLAAAIREVIVQPPSSCNGTDGFISISAFNEFNDPLEFSIDGEQSWQADSVFAPLGPGLYTLSVRNTVNNCISNIGEYNVPDGCDGFPECPVTFNLLQLDGNTWQISMLPEVSYEFPNNFTSTAQITLKVPTGGFDVTNVNNQINGVAFAENSRYDAPNAAPNFDYISFGLTTTGTQNIPYQAGQEVALFTFQNGGQCVGDSIYLMSNEDAFFPPNDEDANVGQQLTVSGYGADMPICLSNAAPIPSSPSITNVVTNDPNCDATDGSITVLADGDGDLEYSIDNGNSWQSSTVFNGLDFGDYNLQVRNQENNNCVIIYENNPITLNEPVDCGGGNECLFELALEQLPSDAYQMSLIPQVTYTFPNNFTGTFQMTIKVPTGGFAVQNFTNLIDGVVFVQNSRYDAPDEDTNFDYITFGLSTTGTQGIPYEEGVKVPLFTFENGGSCSDASLFIMDNETDPFFPPNSENASVGNQITVSGFGADAPICLSADNSASCFAPLIIPTDTIYATISPVDVTEMCIDSVLQLPNGIGEGSLCSANESIDILIENGEDCLLINPNSQFGQVEEICVIFCDANDNSICDTTYLVLCPAVYAGEDLAICPEDNVQLNVVGGTNNFSWTPETGLSCSDCPNPMASPTFPTTYIVSSDNGEGCASSDTISITIADAPKPEFFVIPPCDGEPAQFLYQTAGDTTNLSWHWDFDDNGATAEIQNPSYTFSGPGLYEVVLTVTSDGCSGVIAQNIPVHPNVNANVGEDQSICNGESVDLMATGGEGQDNITYSWTPTDGLSCTDCPNPTANPTTTTSYTVTISNEFDCSASDEVTVNVGGAISISNVAVTNPVDCQDTSGSISITATCEGGCDLEYSINGGQDWFTSSQFDEVTAGQYNIQVRAANSDCVEEYDSNPVSITVPEGPAIDDVDTTDPSVCGVANGSILIQTTGGIAPVQYSIDGGDTFQESEEFFGLSAGTYNIVVTNNDGSCPIIFADEVQLINPGDFGEINVTTTEASCVGNDASIFIEMTGNNVPANLEYSIDGGQNWSASPNFTNNAAGDYNIQVRVENSNCVEIYENNPVEIEAADAVVIDDVQSNNPSSCGLTDGSISISASGGTGALRYSIDDGDTFQNSPDFDNIGEGVYMIVVSNSDGSCETTWPEDIVLSAPSDLGTIQVDNNNPTNCISEDGSISINVDCPNNNCNLEYSIDNGDSWSASSDFQNLPFGEYNILVRSLDGGCLTPFTDNPIIFENNNPPTVTTPIENTSTCEGENVPISITLSEAISSFTINGNGDFTNEAVNGATLTFEAIATQSTTDFDVEIIGESGCAINETFQITRENAPTADFDLDENICIGGTTEILFTGEASFLATLEWGVDGGEILSSSPATGTNPEGANISVRWFSEGEKTIILTATEGNCEATSQATISVIPFGLTATPTVTDAGGCGSNDGAISLDINPAGDYTFVWEGPNDFSAFDANIDNLAGGMYSCTITDENQGCTLVVEATVNEGSEVAISEISTTDNEGCEGGSGSIWVNITESESPYTYRLLEDGDEIASETTDATSFTFENIAAGNYTVEISDANSCTATQNDVVVNGSSDAPPTLTIENVVNTECGAANGSFGVLVSGTASAYAYELYIGDLLITSGDLSSSNEVIFTDLDEGTYTVVMTDDGNCSSSEEVSIGSDATEFEVEGTTTPPSCDVDNGTITLSNFPNGATFEWSASNGMVLPNESALTNLATGVYTVTVTDPNGCSDEFTYTLDPSDGPQIILHEVRNIPCGGFDAGVVVFEVVGEGTFSYEVLDTDFSGGIAGNTIDSITQIPEGSYILEVVNEATACAASVPFTIESPDELEVIATVNPATECYVFDGSICLEITGGTPPYTIEADNGIVPDEPVFGNTCIEGLYDGLVDLKVFDANDCIKVFRVSFDEVPECSDTIFANIPATETTEICFEDAIQLPGPIESAAICNENTDEVGVTLNEIETCIELQPEEGFSGQAETICVIHCQDIQGNSYCDTTYFSIEVDAIPCELAVDEIEITPAACGATTGSATIHVSGNAGNLIYTWTDELSTTNTIADVAAGTYMVTITDEETRCDLIETIVIEEADPLTMSLSANETNCGQENGLISINIQGGTRPFNISWTGPESDVAEGVNTPFYILATLPTGEYSIAVEDDNGCTTTETIVVEQRNSDLSMTAEAASAPTCDSSNGSISVTISDVQGNYDLWINDSLWLENEQEENWTFSDLAAGEYHIVVEDASGCPVETTVTLESETIPPLETSDIIINNISCEGATNGTIESNLEYPLVIFDNENNRLGLTPMTGLDAGEYIAKDTVSLCPSELMISIINDEMPALSEAGLVIKDISCAGEASGGIESDLEYPLVVFDSENNRLGLTPITGLSAGTFIVKDTISPCPSELEIILDDVTPFEIEISSTPETCEGDNGTITLQVSGGNGSFSYNWMPDVSNINVATNLSADSIYAVTITDMEGCDTVLTDLIVALDCDTIVVEPECTPFFQTNYYTISTADTVNEVCLPLLATDASDWNILLNDTAYMQTLGMCTDSLIFYSMSLPLSTGEGPYRLNSWTFGESEINNFEFTTVEELVEMMAQSDPLGNWTYIAFDQRIQGGAAQLEYSQLVVEHIGTGTMYELELSYVMQNRFSILLEGFGEQTMIIEEGECSDTLTINLIEEMMDMDTTEMTTTQTDTLYIEIMEGDTIPEICVDTEELEGTPSEVGLCDTPSNGNVILVNELCVEYISNPEFIGTDTLCLVICDDMEVCDTTIVIVSVEEEDVMEEPDSCNYISEAMLELDTENCEDFALFCLPIDSLEQFQFFVNETVYMDTLVPCGDFGAIVLDIGFHEVVIGNKFNFCMDTVLVDVQAVCDTIPDTGNEPTTETEIVTVEVPLDETETLCLNLNELEGNIIIAENICEDPLTEIADVILSDDGCMEITGLTPGIQQACIVLCDDMGTCDTTLVVITVTGGGELIIYNGFSPNGDDVNEHFHIENIELYPNNSLIIFNRWGNRVYETEGYANRTGWQGGWTEKDLPDGTYFYILDDGAGTVYKGFLEVRR